MSCCNMPREIASTERGKPCSIRAPSRKSDEAAKDTLAEWVRVNNQNPE